MSGVTISMRIGPISQGLRGPSGALLEDRLKLAHALPDPLDGRRAEDLLATPAQSVDFLAQRVDAALIAAAVYARYSSENQRPESIDDQISECRKLARQRSIVISNDHIFSDQAQSGARSDRPALAALMAAAQRDEFDVVFVDDLSAWRATTT